MKLFWAILIVFIAAAGFLLFGPSRPGDVPQQAAETTPEVPSLVTDEVDEPESPLFAPPPGDEPLDNATDVREENDMEHAVRELADDLLASSQQSPSGDDEDDGANDVTSDWPTSIDSGAAGAGDHQHQPITTAENPWAVEGDFALGDERRAAERLQHSIVQQDDGSLLLDDTFVIRGSGTVDSPYEVTWDLLMSAAETYQPRLGMEDIPERIAMLDGKHVKISGHLMFPMITGQADELLVMLNMWDGCCIGTMPSPYDAIEVQLGRSANAGNQQFFNYGTIEGKFSVDPYLINDWLIGLYVLEEATLHIGM